MSCLPCEAHAEAAGWLSECSILGMNEPKPHSFLLISQLQSNHLHTPCNPPPSPRLLQGCSWSEPHYWLGQQPLPGGRRGRDISTGGFPTDLFPTHWLLCLAFKAHEHPFPVSSPIAPTQLAPGQTPRCCPFVSWAFPHVLATLAPAGRGAWHSADMPTTSQLKPVKLAENQCEEF